MFCQAESVTECFGGNLKRKLKMGPILSQLNSNKSRLKIEHPYTEFNTQITAQSQPVLQDSPLSNLPYLSSLLPTKFPFAN